MARVDTTPGLAWLREQGYEVPDTGMSGHISRWWDWMQATCAFYDDTAVYDKTTYKVERITMCPGKMICEDWASIVFNEDTIIGLSGVTDLDDGQEPEANLSKTNDWLQEWIQDSELLDCSSPFERAFGLGTAAWALGLEDINEDGSANEKARVILQWYDARSIIPLSWNGHGIIAAAFVLPVVIGGKQLNQVTLHAPGDNGNYFIKTAFFKGNNQRVVPEGFTTEVKTNSKTPTFAFISPAIDNTYEDHSPLGVSVIDRCIGSIKVTDGAFDNLWKDLFLGQKMLLMSESLIKHDEQGNAIVPRSQSQQLFLDVESNSIESKDLVHEYNPDLRVSDNRTAINTGLALLGKRAGFGIEYYELDKDGAIGKTAKEVASANAELMRNAHKHEKKIETALIQICTAAVELAKQFIDQKLSSVDGLITVNFGDTIIEDDTSARENDRADVAAGLLPEYKYIMKWHGVSEEEAKAWVQGEPVVPEV